jgi:hypothetical protein
MTMEPNSFHKNNRAPSPSIAIEGIQTVLREILDTHPAGLSEYDLLKGLAKRDVSLFNDDYFNNPFGLFQRHFLLFHCLYRLRNSLRATGQGDLTIHCMAIQLIPYGNMSSDHPALPDSFANYYLDLNNLKTTGEADVLGMLDNFWKKCAGNEQRDEALAVLKLTPPTSYPDIKQQYRRLAMQWHPDRGGEPEQFHQLECAMEILRILYK